MSIELLVLLCFSTLIVLLFLGFSIFKYALDASMVQLHAERLDKALAELELERT